MGVDRRGPFTIKTTVSYAAFTLKGKLGESEFYFRKDIIFGGFGSF